MFYLIVSLVIIAATILGGIYIPHSTARKRVVLVGVALQLLFTAFNSFTIIETRRMGIVTHFGQVVSEVALPAGPHLVSPFSSVIELPATQLLIDVNEGSEKDAALASMSKDRIGLRINVAFPIQLNPELAPRIYREYYNWTEGLARPSALSAIRMAAARYDWTDAAVEKNDEFAREMTSHFQAQLIDRLTKVGLSADDAKRAFSIPIVQLRSILPPERLLQANSERQAAQVDLERQAVLTQIAEQEARRRKQDGVGIANLFEQLPKGFNAQDIALILGAVSTKTQADALMRSVEDGKVQTMVIPYAAGMPAVSIAPK